MSFQVLLLVVSQAVGAPADRALLGTVSATMAQEITLGALARQQAASLEVRRFGDRLLRDQVEADLFLRKYVRARNIELPESPDAEREQANRARLFSLRGPAFDRAFLEQALEQIERGTAALDIMRQQVRDPALRDLGARLTPVLEQNRQLARDLLSKVH